MLRMTSRKCGRILAILSVGEGWGFQACREVGGGTHLPRDTIASVHKQRKHSSFKRLQYAYHVRYLVHSNLEILLNGRNFRQPFDFSVFIECPCCM